jgi:hypothetical protein
VNPEVGQPNIGWLSNSVSNLGRKTSKVSGGFSDAGRSLQEAREALASLEQSTAHVAGADHTAVDASFRRLTALAEQMEQEFDTLWVALGGVAVGDVKGFVAKALSKLEDAQRQLPDYSLRPGAMDSLGNLAISVTRDLREISESATSRANSLSNDL